MPSVMVCVISWATLSSLSRDATQYSVAIRALSWALLALHLGDPAQVLEIRLGHHGRGHFIDTSVGSGLVQLQTCTYRVPGAAKILLASLRGCAGFRDFREPSF